MDHTIQDRRFESINQFIVPLSDTIPSDVCILVTGSGALLSPAHSYETAYKQDPTGSSRDHRLDILHMNLNLNLHYYQVRAP